MNDDRIYQVISELIPQPQEIPYILLLYGGTEFHFNGNHASVGPFDDTINFVTATVLSEVIHLGLGALRADSNAQRNQRFEEISEKGSIGRKGLAGRSSGQKGTIVQAE